MASSTHFAHTVIQYEDTPFLYCRSDTIICTCSCNLICFTKFTQYVKHILHACIFFIIILFSLNTEAIAMSYTYNHNTWFTKLAIKILIFIAVFIFLLHIVKPERRFCNVDHSSSSLIIRKL